MNTGNKVFFPCLLLTLLSLPSAAQVVVSNPANASSIQSPFTLSATASTCSDETVTTMEYSLDSSPDTISVSGTSIDTSVATSVGAHTINVTASSEGGAVCVTNVPVTVTGTGGSAVVPLSAISVSSLQTMSNWKAVHDTGGKGKASGSTTIVSSPSMGGSSRKFSTSYKDNGDERYSLSFADDRTSTNFFYDAWVYINKSAADIGNIEMDMNQTMTNGATVIYGVQCDGWSGTWDYTMNAGTVKHQIDRWMHTKSACNPRSWSVNTWHHVQISYSRDDNGVVSYQSVWLDGAEQGLNATVPSATKLGWGSSLVTNFQVDGYHGNGSSVVYLDNLVISRW